MDSRGEGLATKVADRSPCEPFVIKIRNGATLGQLVDMVDAFLCKFPYHVVYIAGGICDVTTKNKCTGGISFVWDPPGIIGPHLVSSLKRADELLVKNHPASKIIFCSLVRSDLQRVVNTHAVSEMQQLAVDDAIFEFNREIFTINKRRRNYSPSLHRTVHRSSKGRRKCHYHHLDDGLYPVINYETAGLMKS